MGYQPIEELLPKAGNSVYKLIRMAATRAIEIAEGKLKLVDTPVTEKTATVALEEIRTGKVVLKEVADQFAPPETPKSKSKSKGKKKDPESEMSVAA